MKKIRITTGLPFGPAQYEKGGTKTPIYYQHLYAVKNWLKKLGKRESMIVSSPAGKFKITKKILDNFIKYE